MKTNTDSENQTADTRPYYEIARETLSADFTALGLSATISEPIGLVGDLDGEHPWPHVAFTVTIGNEQFPYKMGIGCVKWPQPESVPTFKRPTLPSGDRFETVVRLTLKHAEVRKEYKKQFVKDQAFLAAWFAKAQKVAPSPSEVLACYCREGLDADQSFENWCADFGYDSDSRKALDTYNACTENGKKARRVLGAENARKFAELSAQL